MPAYFYFNLLDFLKQLFFKSPVAPYGQTMEVGGIKEKKKSTFKDTESNQKKKKNLEISGLNSFNICPCLE